MRSQSGEAELLPRWWANVRAGLSSRQMACTNHDYLKVPRDKQREIQGYPLDSAVCMAQSYRGSWALKGSLRVSI